MWGRKKRVEQGFMESFELATFLKHAKVINLSAVFFIVRLLMLLLLFVAQGQDVAQCYNKVGG